MPIDLHKAGSRLAVAAATLLGLAPVAAQAQQQVVTLQDMPADMLTFSGEGGWMPAQRAPGRLPGSVRTNPPGRPCYGVQDKIDLGRVRANGYTVVGHDVSGDAGPRGWKRLSHTVIRPFKRSGPTRLLNAHNPAEIDVIAVSPAVWVLDVPVRGKVQRMACSAKWTMTVRVIGPQGSDPYRGR